MDYSNLGVSMLGPSYNLSNLEDFVTIRIFFDDVTSSNTKEYNLKLLREKCLEIYEKLFDILKCYLFNVDSFFLYPIILDNNEGNEPCLYCYSRVGDYIEDEWYMVYLSIILTEKLNNSIVQIQDLDGEFILIESSIGIPSWLSPECSNNRVFIRDGYVRIILNEKNKIIKLKDGLRYIKDDNTSNTIAKPVVQKIIKKRINKYNNKTDIEDNTHIANCLLPKKLSKLFNDFPQLISLSLDHIPPVKYNSKKIIKNNKSSTVPVIPLDTVIDDELIISPIRFTRFQFARLENLTFNLSGRFSSKNWLKEVKSDTEIRDHSAEIRGAKICLGFKNAFELNKSHYSNAFLFNKNDTLTNINEWQKRLEILLDINMKRNDMSFQEVFSKYYRDISSVSIDYKIKESSNSWMTVSSSDIDSILKKKQKEDMVYEYIQQCKKEGKSLYQKNE